MKQPINLILDIFLTLIATIFSYLFFHSVSQILSLDKLFSFENYSYFLLILPILFFALAFIFTCFEVLISKFKLCSITFPFAFLLSQSISIYSIISAVIIGIAVFYFGYSFKSDMNNFKRPSIARCFGTSIGTLSILFCAALVLNFFPEYNTMVSNPDNIVNDKTLNLIVSVASQFGGKDNPFSGNETLRSYSMKTLEKQKVPISPENIDKVISQLKDQLGIEANQDDKLSDIYKKMIGDRLKEFILNYQTPTLAILLVSFFFLLQTLIKLGSIISNFFIFIIEKILNISGVKLYDENPIENKQIKNNVQNKNIQTDYSEPKSYLRDENESKVNTEINPFKRRLPD